MKLFVRSALLFLTLAALWASARAQSYPPAWNASLRPCKEHLKALNY